MELVIRDLFAEDIDRGFLETLTALAEVRLRPREAVAVFQKRLRSGVLTYVALDGDRVVGTASLLVEQKFIHGGGAVGHVEDVAVHPDYQHRGIGTALVNHTLTQARQRGCYKVILNCFDSLIPFYLRMGFRHHDACLRIDL
jgi:glucosamine-phosphate N-acetyltransferase